MERATLRKAATGAGRGKIPARKPAARGFSLIELVIVVVIIGVIAAIAIPRMSRGAGGAADNALAADMVSWRNALDHYQAEHNNQYPASATALVSQLTNSTDGNGNVGTGQNFPYGPYLRSIPPLPVGTEKGKTAVAAYTGTGAPTSVTAGGVGWLYDGNGTIWPNTGSATDATGNLYTGY